MSSNIIQRGVMAALAGVGALALAACSGGSTSAGSAVGTAKGGTLTIAVSGDARTLDPANQQEQKAQAATARLDELVYAVPIATVPSLQAVSTNISNVPQEFWTTEMNPFSPGAGEAWQTAG